MTRLTSAMADFEELIPEPYRRDHKPFEKRLERKPLLNLKRHDGVINRRNGCSSTVVMKNLKGNL